MAVYGVGFRCHMNAKNAHTIHEKPPKRVFFAAVVIIFFCSVSAADSIGFVPNYIDGSASADANQVTLSELPQLGLPTQAGADVSAPTQNSGITALPERIKIPAIALDLPVQNPNTRDIAALDALLPNGPARYVDSAKLGEAGNMIIFAHSSRLPVVHNQMFRAFNKVPDLKAGDTITIESGGKAYLYSVTSVRKADASDATIDLSPHRGTKLTLVTCDTLTGKSARYILEADFVGTI